MTKRVLYLLAALGLIVGALAGLTTAPAPAQQGPQNPGQNAIFFPWVPNGETLNGTGPWYGTVTVQNLNNAEITVDFHKPGDSSSSTPILSTVLEPFASKTLSAAQLGISSPGGAVVALAECSETVTVTHGALDSTDTVTAPVDTATPNIVVKQGSTTYVSGTDYTIQNLTSTGFQINWNTGNVNANEPAPGSQYKVSFNLAPGACPAIAGAEKHVAPSASTAAQTSSAQTIVSGYTALPLSDVTLSRGLTVPTDYDTTITTTGQWNWVLPIVQTNNGWDSIIHVTNVSQTDACGVTVIFYPQGTNPSVPNSFTTTLNMGQSATVDLLALGTFPTGLNTWVGSAWVSSDCAIVGNVDRVKASTMMALTNVAQPRVSSDQGGGPQTVYAPLIFQTYNGWNTGINIANLGDSSNTVTVTFYNQAGTAVAAQQVSIGARSMTYVYRPNFANVGIGGIAQAVISGTGPLAAVVDEVKYMGTKADGMGQAMSYLAQTGGVEYDGLALPLFQRGAGAASPFGDTSGINLFNASSTTAATIEVTFYDQSGAKVAPTLSSPVVTTIPAFGGLTIYAPTDLSTLPLGFQGSAVIKIDSGGPVSGVSNDVNYAVQGDGSAVFNLAVVPGLFTPPPAPTTPPPPQYSLTLSPASATNLIDQTNQHTVTATLTLGGNPQPGVNILFFVSAADQGDTVSPSFDAVPTDNNGHASLTYTFTDGSGNGQGVTTVGACADLNGNNVCDSGEPTASVPAVKYWVSAQFAAALKSNFATATDVGNDVQDGTASVTVFGNTNASLPVVFVITNGTATASFAPCSQTGQTQTSTTVSGGSTGTVPFYVCSGGSNSTFTIEAYWDKDNSGTFNSGDLQIGNTVTIQLP